LFDSKVLQLAVTNAAGAYGVTITIEPTADGTNYVGYAVPPFTLYPADGTIYRYLPGNYQKIRITATAYNDPGVNPASTLDVFFGASTTSRYYPTGYTVSSNFTRPKDTTAYTALDVVGNGANMSFSFSSGPGPAADMLITGAAIRIDRNSVPAGMSSYRLHLYQTAPTPIADNAAYTLASADRDKYLGYVDLPTPVVMGDTLYNQADGVNHKITLSPRGGLVYGILQTTGAFTPAEQTVYTVTLHTMVV
jgi:hypothetical protein